MKNLYKKHYELLKEEIKTDSKDGKTSQLMDWENKYCEYDYNY
jgi:hypothetical protein